MSDAQRIRELANEGLTNEQIAAELPNATRRNIQNVAGKQRKTGTEEQMEQKTEEQSNPSTEPKEKSLKEQLEAFFSNDGKNEVKEPETKVSGNDYHKKWIKDAKYTCGNCGFTINKNWKKCPFCGEELDWGILNG